MTRATVKATENDRELARECRELAWDELDQVSGGADFHPPNPCRPAGGTSADKIIVVC
jgi:hypothetical protein